MNKKNYIWGIMSILAVITVWPIIMESKLSISSKEIKITTPNNKVKIEKSEKSEKSQKSNNDKKISARNGVYFSYSKYLKEAKYSDTQQVVFDNEKKSYIFDSPKIIIKDDSVVYISDGEKPIYWKIDKKNSHLTHSKLPSCSYTYDEDIFSFNGESYVRKGSKLFKEIIRQYN